MVNYKELNYLLKQKKLILKFCKINFCVIYHNLTLEVSLPQIISAKKHTKTT